MYCSVLFIVAFVIVLFVVINSERKREIDETDVPKSVISIVNNELKDLAFSTYFKQGRRYLATGRFENREIEVKFKLKNQSEVDTVRKTEIHFEMERSNRRLLNKVPVDPKQIPQELVLKMESLLSEFIGRIDSIYRVEMADSARGKAYDLKGWSGSNKFELEILADGTPLELEIKYDRAKERTSNLLE